MKGITRRAFSLFVCLIVLLSIASYGGLAEPWEGKDLGEFDTADISSEIDNNDLRGIEWADGGSVLFVSTRDSPFIYQLEPDRPYSIKNLTFVAKKSHPNNNGPDGIELSPDGTKLFLMDGIDDEIERYTLSDPYNLSSATSSPDQTLFVGTNGNGFTFNDDGTELSIAFSQTKNSGFDGHLEVWSLGSAYDLSGASQDGSDIVLDHHGQDVVFGDNGTKLYIGEGSLSSGSLSQYDLPTQYDASSLENRTSHNLPGISDGTGLDWGPGNGRKLYVGGQNGIIHELTTANYTVSGFVLNESGAGIEGAEVAINETGDTTVTNETGFYQFAVENGTYTINATFEQLQENETTVEVSGSSVENANITLFEPLDIEIDTVNHLFHNQTADFNVIHENGTDVTAAASITVENTDLITIEGDNTPGNPIVIAATADESKVNETLITATYKGATATKRVAVTGMSADSLKYQQDAGRMLSATWGDVAGPDGERAGGTQLTARIIAVALLVGVPLSRELNGLAGISGFGITMTAGWFMGWVGTDMVLITAVVCLFIGLNTAQMRARREGPI